VGNRGIEEGARIARMYQPQALHVGRLDHQRCRFFLSSRLGLHSPFEECPVFKPYANQARADACEPEKGKLEEPQGDVDWAPINALPGCNKPCKSQSREEKVGRIH
jgi:hypothetical protein